jgi:hypothetical protein
MTEGYKLLFQFPEDRNFKVILPTYFILHGEIRWIRCVWEIMYVSPRLKVVFRIDCRPVSPTWSVPLHKHESLVQQYKVRSFSRARYCSIDVVHVNYFKF